MPRPTTDCFVQARPECRTSQGFTASRTSDLTTRFTAQLDSKLPRIAVDLGYSATARSCGLCSTFLPDPVELSFGECVRVIAHQLVEKGPQTLILEAVLSTYHTADGNPSVRGLFEKGRGWYHGPGVSTFAAAHRYLHELDRLLPADMRPIPLVEGFLSYKPTRTKHGEDAVRILREFDNAERYMPELGSEPLCKLIDDVPEIRRYNPPPEVKR